MNTTATPARRQCAGAPHGDATARPGKDYDACVPHASRHIYGGRPRWLSAPAALAALFVLHLSLPLLCTAQQRDDNRRLFFSGTGPTRVWDNSSANWTTLGSYLSYVDHLGASSAIWSATLPSGAAVTGSRGVPFLNGDVAVFDSWSDSGYVWTGSNWLGSAGDTTPGSSREIAIAAGGVRASDVVVNAAEVTLTNHTTGVSETVTNHYTFTGGGITAGPDEIAPGSVQLAGTGVTPTGRLVKTGIGTLTLSNDTNRFAGGILLLGGVLSVTNTTALGDNNIILDFITSVGGADGAYGLSSVIGEKLIDQVQSPGGGPVRPAIVTSANGSLASAPGAIQSLHIASSADGIDITGDIFIANRTLTLQIDGDTTISGRIVGWPNSYGTSGGTLVKEGEGTLILSGTRNWFYGTAPDGSLINAGRVVATTPYALGHGAWKVNPGTTLEFRGVRGTMRQSFTGGGNVEITGGSDLAFDWRNGSLSNYDALFENGSYRSSKNELGTILVKEQSRFSAIASGTYSEVLGGANVNVEITEGSTLVLGREGLSARGSGGTKIPMTYAILANRIDLTGGSTLVLNPSAYLSTGALVFPDTDITSIITFGASGVSRLRVQESNVDPDNITTTSGIVRYVIPDGMKLTINNIPVPISPSQSIPNDNSSSGWCREYVLVNQGANPLKDITLTLNALDALHDTLYSRLADELVDPVTRHSPARKRKWVNEAWVRYISSQMDYDRTSITTPGVEGRVNGLVAGADALLPGRVLLGIHGTIADNTLDTTNATSLSSKHKILGLHAAQRFGKFYLSAAADTGRASTISYRNEAGNLIRGRWDTSYYTGAVQIGATFTPWQNTVLKPFAGLRYAKLDISGHNETGSNFSPMEVKDFGDASAQATYGVAIGRKFKLFKREFAADLSLARKHTIRSPRETLAVRYYDSPTTPVTLERGDYYADLTAIGLNLRAALSKHTIVGLALDYETASTQNRTTASLLVGYTW
jgi:autotransporter-associated beta strand protein